VLFRQKNSSDQLATVGIAQGQFAVQEITASFRKQKLKPTIVRTNKVYPLVKTSMVACFVDPSTMVFGTPDAVRVAPDARDGAAPSLLTNAPMMDAMKSVDTEPLSCRYGMDFQHGVHLNLSIETGATSSPQLSPRSSMRPSPCER
jgi:hypothetical protein